MEKTTGTPSARMETAGNTGETNKQLQTGWTLRGQEGELQGGVREGGTAGERTAMEKTAGDGRED